MNVIVEPRVSKELLTEDSYFNFIQTWNNGKWLLCILDETHLRIHFLSKVNTGNPFVLLLPDISPLSPANVCSFSTDNFLCK
jgi:hypothetical protein